MRTRPPNSLTSAEGEQQNDAQAPSLIPSTTSNPPPQNMPPPAPPPQFDPDTFFDSLSDDQVMGMMQFAPLPASAYDPNESWLDNTEVDAADMELFEEFMSNGSLPQALAAQSQSMMPVQGAVAGRQLPLTSLPVNMQAQAQFVKQENPFQGRLSTIDSSSLNLALNAENEAPPPSLIASHSNMADDTMMTSELSPAYSDTSSHVLGDSPDAPQVVASNVVIGDSSAMDTNTNVSMPFELPKSVIIANVPSTSATPPPTRAAADTKSKSRRTSSVSSSRTKRTSARTRDANVSRDVSPAAVTPVAVIENIVGDKVKSSDIYRDAASKPIKHQVELSADSALDRSVKNAINARANRQKHKQHVQALEEENALLKERIAQLERDKMQLERDKAAQQQEVTYLQSVIANDSTIARVLQGLGNVKQVRLTSGFVKANQQRKRTADDAMDASSEKRATHAGDVTAGVCLHVQNDDVSVEFCDRCANMAELGKT